jgi:hypothetical protein
MIPTLRINLSSDTIANVSSASSLAVHISSPVLALADKLFNIGIDPATPLACYRGETLALKVRSIGEAAHLEVSGAGTGFRPATKPGRGPLVSQSGSGATALSSAA